MDSLDGYHPLSLSLQLNLAHLNIMLTQANEPPAHAHEASQPAPQSEWLETSSACHDDPLLGCLEIMVRFWHRPQSPQALKAGLPLQENRFTPDIFVRAATQANLSAKVVKKNLKNISPLTLPAVLLLKGCRACVLVGLGPKAGEARILLPETGDGEGLVPLKRLAEEYTGKAIFVRPTFRFDARAEEVSPRPEKNWFWGALARYWPIYGEAMLASLMINFFALVSPLFVMNVYDRVVPNNAQETLWVLAIGVTIVYGFDFIIRTLRGYFLDMAGKKADILMASAIFQHVNSIRLSSQPPSTGALARNLLEFETLRDFFTSATLTTLIDLPFIFLFLWVIQLLGGEVVWAPAIAAPLVIAVGFFLQWPLGHVVRKTFREASQKHAILVETLSCLETIKILGAEGTLQGKWEQVVGLTAQSGLLSRFISSLAMNFSLLAQQLAVVGLVVIGVYRIEAGELTTGALVACTILAGRALAPLSQVAGLLVRFQQSMISLEALHKIMAMPVERPKGQPFPSRPNLTGALTFTDLTFAYPGQPTKALDHISFSMRPGERIAFIGRIGSGKSTLLKMVAALYQPDQGAILADGVDLRQIDPVDLRRNIGFVEQEPVLFFGSLRDNIVMADPFAEDADLLRAAQQGGLDEFVNRHPHGFNQIIGERGRGLSGGQRHAVAIARALLANPPILLMDEPTSAMDSGSEERFKARMAKILPGKSLLLVTHKASLLSLVERIIVIEEGKIAADGPRDVVLQKLAQGQLRAPTTSQVGGEPR